MFLLMGKSSSLARFWGAPISRKTNRKPPAVCRDQANQKLNLCATTDGLCEDSSLASLGNSGFVATMPLKYIQRLMQISSDYVLKNTSQATGVHNNLSADNFQIHFIFIYVRRPYHAWVSPSRHPAAHQENQPSVASSWLCLQNNRHGCMFGALGPCQRAPAAVLSSLN